MKIKEDIDRDKLDQSTIQQTGEGKNSLWLRTIQLIKSEGGKEGHGQNGHR